MAHTKTYTKVVLDQNEEVLGSNQPAEALIGKCIKIKVTEAQKWHISGYVIDLNPAPEKVSANYFEELKEKRK